MMIDNRRMNIERQQSAKAYWLSQLSGEWPRMPLPCQKQQAGSYLHEQLRLELPEELAYRLWHIAKQNELSLFTIVLSAAKAWVYRLNEQEDTSFAVPLYAVALQEIAASNRKVVVRDRMRPDMSFKAVLSQVRLTVSQSYRHQLYALSEVWESLGSPEGKPDGSLLAFAMTGLHPDEHIDALLEEPHEAAFVFAKREGGISLQIRYNGASFEEEAMLMYGQSFLHAVQQLTDNPNLPISELKLLTDEQREHIVNGFNNTEKPYSSHYTIPQLFERQTSDAPDQAAVLTSGGLSTTYAELNEQANRLASLLKQIGVGPGIYVAILMDRSLDMIVGVLGILKAGGAYVPLDPGYPKARIETIMNSLNSRCLLSKASMMQPYQELVWKLSQLRDIVYMDVQTEVPESERVQEESVRALWDLVVEESVDWVTAGGFISSYNGQPLAEAEVGEYRERVVKLAKDAIGPHSSVLEVGCGSGLLSFELAPLVKSYVGLDPSEKMLARNQAKTLELRLEGVEWIGGFAHDMDQMKEESFDLIVIASTVQFFPGYAYLSKIVKLALRCLRPGGTLLLADIMDLRRKEKFRETLETYKRQHGTDGITRTAMDRELYCDEAYFHDLQAVHSDIAEIRVLHRETGFRNELGFRYDVTLKKADGIRAEASSFERSKRIWTKVHLERQPAHNQRSGITSDDEAYVIFTSGSTGTPKGVIVRHKPVINVIEWVNGTHGVNRNDMLLFITPLCFDLSVYDLFGTLAAGGTIRIASDEEARDPERLLRIVRTEAVTIWDSAPAALQQLVPFMRMSAKPTSPLNSGSSLRLALLSGDWIPLTLPDAMKTYFPGVQVTGMGGATEATVWSNYYPIDALNPNWVSIPYGKPIQNARYYILDSKLEPCPLFVPGELYIGGECLASGYTDPVLTAERFIADPFVRDDQARMYKTGDLAKWMPDGNIVFMGRADNQVKIRGYRIELGEIEAQLLKYEAVKEVLVVDRTDRNGHQSLCAYYTADGEVQALDLKKHAVDALPAYMVPAFYVQVAAMPLTSNGKVDRKSLPDPADSRNANETLSAVATSEEQRLIEIWQNVLCIGRIGATDDFFDLGGDSLQAVQVVAMANEARIHLSLRDILQHRTVREIMLHGGGSIASDDAAAEREIAVSSGSVLSRKYNRQFRDPDTKVPYYFPCFMGAIYAKLSHEHGYRIPRSFLPAGDGFALITYGYRNEGSSTRRLGYMDVSHLGDFRLSEQFGISAKTIIFETVEEGLAWCDKRLSENELVVMMGTTYSLNYCKDYLMEPQSYIRMLRGREENDDGRGSDNMHAHMFVLVDHMEQDYLVYDSSFNYFGAIGATNLQRSFAGLRGLSFIQDDASVKYRHYGNAVIDITMDSIVPIPQDQLALQLLVWYTEAYLGLRKLNRVDEGINAFSGLESYEELIRSLSDEEAGSEWVPFSGTVVNNWKYKFIFLRDFLQDVSLYLPLPSLPDLLRAVNDAIARLTGWYARIEAIKPIKPIGILHSDSDINGLRNDLIQGFKEMQAAQMKAFLQVHEELTNREDENR